MNKLISFAILIFCAMTLTGQISAIADLETRTAKGDAEAMRLLAYRYQTGDGIEADYEKAFSLYRQSAAKGVVTAGNDMGWCLLHGYGVVADTTLAIEAFNRAAGQGDAYALLNLALCLRQGIGIERDLKKSLKMLQRASEAGNPMAWLQMGYHQLVILRDSEKAVSLIRQAAEAGLAEAQYAMGCLEHEKSSSAASHQAAADWWSKASRQGYVEAFFNLGWCYEHGDGVKQDRSKAFDFYSKAAEAGEAEAQYHLGCLYYGDDKTDDRDYAEAVKWFAHAAKRGNLGGAALLGECYYRGQGVVRDYDQAFEWLSRAVEDEDGYINPRAMRLLSACYRYGRGTDEDQDRANELMRMAARHGDTTAQANLGVAGLAFRDKPHSLPWYPIAQLLDDYGEHHRAVKLYQQAAQAGNADAQYAIAEAYYNGKGIKRVYSMAARWYRMAAMQNHPAALYKLAHCYANARGVPRLHQKAVQLLMSSANAGYRPAQSTLAHCYEQGMMTHKDDAEAKKWAQLAERGFAINRPSTIHPAADNEGRQLKQ